MIGSVLGPVLTCLAVGPAAPDTVTLTPAVDLHVEFEKALAEFDEAQAIQVKQPDRARRLFQSAAQRFASIRAAGVRNGRLEYNLGNCHLQAGDVGRAILHYRRAQRLIPRDPRLEDNLGVARSRCLTSIKPAARSAFLRSAFFWHFRTSQAGRARAAALSFVAIWVFLSIRGFIRSGSLAASALVCAGLTLVIGSSLVVSHWSDRHRPEGVVTAMDVVVSKGPGEGYQRLFEQPLQPGVEFTHRDRRRTGLPERGTAARRAAWWNIELPDGNRGWIPAETAELIPEAVP